VEEVADDPHLATYPYLAATRADLLRRLGRTQDAAQAYRTALTLATNDAENGFLARRLAEVTAT
jgi:RNA polymerase sigma-70 factor (ECF subfamily)